MFRRLLKRISHTDQLRLAPRCSDKRNPDRQSAHESGGHSDVRITGDRCRGREAATTVVAANEVRKPSRAAARCHQRIELVVQQGFVDAGFAGELQVVGERIEIFLAVQPTFAAARIMCSCAKCGITRSRFFSLNAMRSASALIGRFGANSARYAAMSALNS